MTRATRKLPPNGGSRANSRRKLVISKDLPATEAKTIGPVVARFIKMIFKLVLINITNVAFDIFREYYEGPGHDAIW